MVVSEVTGAAVVMVIDNQPVSVCAQPPLPVGDGVYYVPMAE